MSSFSSVGHTLGQPSYAGCPPNRLGYTPQVNPPYATMPTQNWGSPVATGGYNNSNWGAGNMQIPSQPASQSQQMIIPPTRTDWRRQAVGRSSQYQQPVTTTGTSAFQFQNPYQTQQAKPQSQGSMHSQAMNVPYWSNQQPFNNARPAEGPIDGSSMQALNQYLSLGQHAAGCHVKFGEGDQPVIYSPGQQQKQEMTSQKSTSANNSPRFQQHPNTGTSYQPSSLAGTVGTTENSMHGDQYASPAESVKMPAPLPSMNRGRPKPCGTCPACKFQTNVNATPGQPHLVRGPRNQRPQMQRNTNNCGSPQFMATTTHNQPAASPMQGQSQNPQ